LIDFGIAKATSHVSETQVGALKGKYAYMSPEQVSGSSVDHRSDIFSAGNLLYELLTGVRLFAGSGDYEVLDKVRTATFTPPGEIAPSIHEGLQAIVMRALERDPNKRYQRADMMAAELRQCIEQVGGEGYTGPALKSFVRELFADECAYMTQLAEKALRARFVEPEPATPESERVSIHEPSGFDTDDPTQPSGSLETRVAMSALSRGPRGLTLVLGALVAAAIMIGGSLWFKSTREAAIRGGGLVVTTQPEGATLHLDGVTLGSSPYSAQGIPAGEHDLSARLVGYSEQRRTLQIVIDEVTIIEFELAPEPNVKR
jgi:serine/threonine protein kinase